MKARNHSCFHVDGESKPRPTYRQSSLLVDYDDVHWGVIDLQYIQRAGGPQR
jgi:hypothetical protein